ncbi:hypothetical protein IMCC9480_2617 [Oxalobacteraceae bacterium IMCC9480]|nr:hypothetical protein IMCC9480_2617 [Oxalobacteraceae bacterium IMCC9480]
MARPASGKGGTRDAFQVHLDAAELGVTQQVGTASSLLLAPRKPAA